MPADARLEEAARDVHGPLDRALVELVGLADVDQHGRLVGGEASGGVGGADLVDLRLHLCKKILVAGHVPANATCIAAIPSRLPCARGSPHRQEARPAGRGRRASWSSPWPFSGALALRSPAPAAAPALVGSAERRAAARARPAGEAGGRARATLAAVAADMRAGRRAQAEAALRRARALLGAGDLRVQVAGALLRYRPGEVETAIGVLRALASNDDRAPVPALHLGLALLWAGPARRGDRRARADAPDRSRRPLRAARPTTSCTPSYRKGYPLWLSSQPGARRARAGCARRAAARAALAARAARLRLRASSSSRARARASSPSARSRSTPPTSTPRSP